MVNERLGVSGVRKVVKRGVINDRCCNNPWEVLVLDNTAVKYL